MPAESADRRAATAAAKGGPGMAPPELEHLPCPRCDSTNTKFCYYNNYNFSQPRHFCKSCRRYWTQGGTLRDIPVGGGTRKNAKRSRTLPPSPSPPPTSFLPAGIVPGSFTSLLNAGPGGFLGLGGIGQGFDDLGFGPLARAMWAFPEVGLSGGNAGGWHMESGEDHPGAGAFAGGDCFPWPELAISTSGNALK